jgi:hypothetical protein
MEMGIIIDGLGLIGDAIRLAIFLFLDIVWSILKCVGFVIGMLIIFILNIAWLIIQVMYLEVKKLFISQPEKVDQQLNSVLKNSVRGNFLIKFPE